MTPCVGDAPGLERLTPQQRNLLIQWLPDAVVEKDLSWGIAESLVFQVRRAGSRFIVKAAGASDKPLRREIHAHQHWIEPLRRLGRAATATHFDEEAKLLVTTYLPGRLVLGSAAADDPDTYRQAGDLLRLLHGQTSVVDAEYESRANARTLAWLGEPHRIAPDVEARLRSEIASWPTPAATLVPTHGDWQPRNWLQARGRVRVIDFGLAELRPAVTDLTRLAALDFARDPALEAAFAPPKITGASTVNGLLHVAWKPRSGVVIPSLKVDTVEGTAVDISFLVRLPVDSSSVPFARGLTTRALKHLEVDQDVIDDIALALTEACANVVRHAGEGHYDVRVEIDREFCRIGVFDEGEGFDPSDVPTELHDTVLESGRGLALMQMLVDSLSFSQDPDHGHGVVLEKRIKVHAEV